MKRHGIVNSRLDLCLGKVFLKPLAILQSDHIQVVDRARPIRLVRSDNTVNRGEHLVVSLRGLPALAIPVRQVAQLDTQHSGLDGIEPTIVPFEIMVILFRLAVVAQHADFARNFFIVRCHRSSFSAGAQILSWIKTEGGRVAHRSSFLPSIPPLG